MAVDLHLHTHYSDGSWSPGQVVNRAIELNLECIAITDHDTTEGIAKARKAASGKIDVITGIELNCVYRNPDGSYSDLHILGYFFDPCHPAIKTIIKLQQDARHKLVVDTIECLREHGHDLSYKQVVACAGKGSIGRPHITRALVKMGHARNVGEAYERFMQRSSPLYVARKSISPHQAIAAVKEAGGLSSIAHPGPPELIADTILALQKHGLDAIEAYHRRHSRKTVRHYIQFARQNGLGVTGGSDCHGPYKDHPATIGRPALPSELLADFKALKDCSN